MANILPNDEIVNDGQRYFVTITSHFKNLDFVVYQTQITDTAFNKSQKFYFRFKVLKRLHEQMIIKMGTSMLPEFPETKRSIFFWKKTNDDVKLIADRKRQLEYYLNKIFNNHYLSNLDEIKQIKKCIKKNQIKRSKSEKSITPPKLLYTKSQSSECPQVYKKDLRVIDLL